jgi:hypothetical protein
MEEQFRITGLKETLQLFQDLASEIGDREARSKILIPAVKDAMKPVLYAAKAYASSDETNMLRDSLHITGKRATNRDRKSRYVTSTDSVIAFVSTRPIPKKLKKKFNKEMFKKGVRHKDEVRSEAKKFYAKHNIFYDARAVVNEFGTANRPAKPYLRPALEGQAEFVAELLGQILSQKIKQYRSKSL